MLTVATLYKFTRFPDPAVLKPGLLACCEAHGVKGTVLLAREGINGTVAGTAAGIAAVLAHIRGLPGCAGLEWKESAAEAMPFSRMKVRLKQEIVTMGQPDVDPAASVGRYVPAAEWNALISAPDVAVIDTRNDYEVEIGSFDGAVDPATKSFGAFPAWWEANRDRFEGKRVAMFCTGGIRCEKATSWLVGQGVEEVYHLQGGILKYLEQVPEADSLWHGACFVFDKRVSLTHGLKKGGHHLCHACRRPLTDDDLRRPEYESGVSCHRCLTEHSESDRGRFRERERQIRLGQARGEGHFGVLSDDISG